MFSTDRIINNFYKIVFAYRIIRIEYKSDYYNLHWNQIQFDNKRYYYLKINLVSPSGELVGFCGIDTSRKIAFEKAFSEYLEAIAFWKHQIAWQISRSGMATAVDLRTAKLRAYTELVERDAFLMCFLAKNIVTFPLNSSQSDLVFVSLPNGDENLKVVMAIADLDGSKPCFIGLGTSESLVLAKEKAALEALMLRLDWPKEIDEVSGLSGNRLNVHFEASASVEVKKRLRSIISGKGTRVPVFKFDKDNIDCFVKCRQVGCCQMRN